MVETSPDQVVEAFSTLGTGTISDALLRVGMFRASFGIHPIDGSARVAGRAFTVLYRSQSVTNPGDVGDYIDDVPPGSVVVLDNRSRVDCTVWGDILTGVAVARQLAGTVIDGVCRDTENASSLNYPLFARGHIMRTGKGRVEVAAVNEPVSLGEAQVTAGDLVVGDRDGICVIPWDSAEKVLNEALHIQVAEKAIAEAVDSGSTLKAARQHYGYFGLQEEDSGSEPNGDES